MNNKVVTDVYYCARCGKHHKQLEFKKMLMPLECDDDDLTHWALCPNTDDPIMLVIKEVFDDSGVKNERNS